MIYPPKRDSAVSPVIGTILLVAITVVLVAIIGAVVMSLADAEDGKKVGMNAQPASGTNVTLLLYGGDSIPELVKLEMIDQGSPNAQYKEIWNKSISGGDPLVGHPYSVSDVAAPLESASVYETTINVKGTFMDGTEKILLVQPMTFYDVVSPTEPFVKISKISVSFSSFGVIDIEYGNIPPFGYPMSGVATIEIYPVNEPKKVAYVVDNVIMFLDYDTTVCYFTSPISFETGTKYHITLDIKNFIGESYTTKPYIFTY